MAPRSYISVETPIQCSPDWFFNLFHEHSYLLKDACGSVVQNIQLDPGNTSWIDVRGSKKQISVVTSPGNNNSETMTDEVTDIDARSRRISFNVSDGPMMQLYTSLNYTLEVTRSNTVKWTIEYVKNKPESEEPIVYVRLLAAVNYGVSDYIVNLNNNPFPPPPQRA